MSPKSVKIRDFSTPDLSLCFPQQRSIPPSSRASILHAAPSDMFPPQSVNIDLEALSGICGYVQLLVNSSRLLLIFL